MRYLIAFFILFFGSVATAATFNCTVPGAATADASAVCEQLRVELAVRTADWNNDQCATELARRGLREYHRVANRRSLEILASEDHGVAMESFDTNFPVQYTPAYCGDGTLDTEFGEECDDGNNDPGDGCDGGCGNE
jgi:cysteine-rich repeat protein